MGRRRSHAVARSGPADGPSLSREGADTDRGGRPFSGPRDRREHGDFHALRPGPAAAPACQGPQVPGDGCDEGLPQREQPRPERDLLSHVQGLSGEEPGLRRDSLPPGRNRERGFSRKDREGGSGARLGKLLRGPRSRARPGPRPFARGRARAGRGAGGRVEPRLLEKSFRGRPGHPWKGPSRQRASDDHRRGRRLRILRREPRIPAGLVRAGHDEESR